MSTPNDEGATRLGNARLNIMTAFARLNLVVLERPTQVPDEAWREITDAASELTDADTLYRTGADRTPWTQEDYSQATDAREILRRAAEEAERKEGEKLFSLNDVLAIVGQWEEAARQNLEQARAQGKPESYYLGGVDTLAHVRADFERRGYQ